MLFSAFSLLQKLIATMKATTSEIKSLPVNLQNSFLTQAHSIEGDLPAQQPAVSKERLVDGCSKSVRFSELPNLLKNENFISFSSVDYPNNFTIRSAKLYTKQYKEPASTATTFAPATTPAQPDGAVLRLSCNRSPNTPKSVSNNRTMRSKTTTTASTRSIWMTALTTSN